MTSLIKNQILKHLTKFFKDLAPEQLQLSAFKGSCEVSNLQLEEKVLMELLSFPAWIRINKATCDQLSIKIPWTKIKSVPIQMNLNEVMVEVEVCEEFRDVAMEDEMHLANLLNNQAPSKYGFVDRVIDGITVTVNSVLITFKSKLMSATFNLSRVVLESRCPNWKPGELSLTRIKDVNRGQILLFKIIDWQTMRLEAKCLTNPNQAPLRLITNHAQCRLTIKKKLDDCSVIAARIFVIFEDILWVLTFAQFISAASFVEYVFALIKRSPMSKKTGLIDESTTSDTQTTSSLSNNSTTTASSSFVGHQSVPLISPLNTPLHSSQNDKAPMLTGNLSSASLLEQKFLCYDLVETSLHLYIDKVDAHLYDDIEVSSNSSSNRDSGGALQTTLDQIQIDCYPYSRAIGDRRHWYKWFDPSPISRRQWFSSHFAEFDLFQLQRKKQAANAADKSASGLLDASNLCQNDSVTNKLEVPTAANEQLLSLAVLVKIKDYAMNCVATKHSLRGAGLNKFIQTDQDYQMPSEMPAIYLELNYFYYFDAINRMMVYDNVPDPLAFIHLSPTKLLFDPPTLVFLNSFHINLSKALVHLNDLFPEETTAPKVHCRIEILMPQISLPAKASPDEAVNINTSTLLVKSGKVILCSSIYDKDLMSKLLNTIEKLKESPYQPISGNHTHSARSNNFCIGDWTKVWNASLINKVTEFTLSNQLWAIQFEPVWMDFMNYDVDGLSTSQRLEPIVEPVNAYAFIHLDLSSSFQKPSGDSHLNTNKRDVISILASVMDGSILANMDKVQFSFLQRLGMHVEKLIQQIKEDASGIIQLDTVVEDTLEINLTAYIKDIKARLILDKKIETTSGEVNTSRSFMSDAKSPIHVPSPKKVDVDKDSRGARNFPSPLIPTILNPFELMKASNDKYVEVASAKETTVMSGDIVGSNESLDECAEVGDDTSCLFLGQDSTKPQDTSAHIPVASSTLNKADTSSFCERTTGKSPIEESLLINLDEMEQSSALFAKVDLKGKNSPEIVKREPTPSTQSDQPQNTSSLNQSQQQEIETESISYLELSMSQLMVRRITETKRRQKF